MSNKTNQKKAPPIRVRFIKREKITEQDCKEMFQLFSVYYQNVSFDVFMEDLNKKTGAHLAKRKCDGRVVGFSTAMAFKTIVNGKKVHNLFNGDTVMAKEYWGHPGLPNSFFRWLLAERFKNPFVEVNWFLVSMGYRTYLILANNFYKYYPDVDGDNPHLRDLAYTAADTLFPGALNRETGLLDFGDDACKLSDFVTPITDKEREVPKIAFFEKRNPTWMQGTEMACIASLDWGTVARVVFFDASRTLFKKGKRKSKRQASSAVVNKKPDAIEVSLDVIQDKNISAISASR